MDANSKESVQPAQSRPTEGVPVTVPPQGSGPGEPPFDAYVETKAAPPGRSRRRIWAARVFALVVDGVQIALLPLVFSGAVSPVDDVIDVVAAAVLTLLVGWHWAFLPTFLAEIVPFVDLVPSWTLATFVATRGRKQDITRP